VNGNCCPDCRPRIIHRVGKMAGQHSDVSRGG
jgi:hypothetical protein